MFTTIVPYRLAQIRRNKTVAESFLKEYVYVFHVRDENRCVKYIVNIKQYEENLLTVEFYPKIKTKNKYKLLTNQFKFGRTGGTILAIMAEIQHSIGISCFGILSASLTDDIDNISNKRYCVYVEILARKVDDQIYTVSGVFENSYIFVIPNYRMNDRDNIILHYEQIFKETN